MPGYSVTYTVVDEATAKIEAINRRIQQLRAPLEHQQRALARFIDASGLQKVADGFTSIAKSGLAAFSSLARVVPPLAAITGAASIAGMVKLVSEFGAWGDTLARDAEKVDLTQSSLYDLQRALEAAGGDASTMTQGLKDLMTAMGAAATGQNPRFTYRLREAGKEALIVNGHFRATDEVLKDVLDDINRSTNAVDRHTKAMDYGGESLDTMAEDFRRSGKPLAEWRAGLAATGLNLADVDRRSREYKRALGELNDAFREVGVELATAFTPLIHEFATWIKQNKPAIVAGTHEIAEGFKFVAENATTIAEIFAVAWGVRAVAGVAAVITQVVALNTALAATGTAGALAAGVLARFGIAGAAVAGIMAAIGLGRAAGVVTGAGGPQWDPAWGPRPEGFAAPGPQPPDTIDRVLNPVRRFLGLPAKEAAPPPPPAGAPTPAPAPSGAPAPTLGREGWYNNPGNIRVSPAAWEGKGQPYTAGSSGGFETFATPEAGVRAAVRNIQAKLDRGITTPAQLAPVLGPANDKNNPMWLAQQYAKALGIGINDPIPNTPEAFQKLIPAITNIEKPYDARSRYTPDVYSRGVGAAFGAPAAAGGDRTPYGNTPEELAFYRQHAPFPTIGGQAPPPVKWTDKFSGDNKFDPAHPFNTPLGGLYDKPAATGAPGQLTTAGASGAVDVTITHKNPPPGASVRATGNGDVNVGAPRTEWQDMQSL